MLGAGGPCLICGIDIAPEPPGKACLTVSLLHLFPRKRLDCLCFDVCGLRIYIISHLQLPPPFHPHPKSH